ncbi:MAG: hypothetical protein LBT62_03000 [Deltaproteobacteria bacterium]|jgi:hypothetical protein|nr:hypothetical protein [Deltaproteobacteria bacterium]
MNNVSETICGYMPQKLLRLRFSGDSNVAADVASRPSRQESVNDLDISEFESAESAVKVLAMLSCDNALLRHA